MARTRILDMERTISVDTLILKHTQTTRSAISRQSQAVKLAADQALSEVDIVLDSESDGHLIAGYKNLLNIKTYFPAILEYLDGDGNVLVTQPINGLFTAVGQCSHTLRLRSTYEENNRCSVIVS